jgi:hypothetical protein
MSHQVILRRQLAGIGRLVCRYCAHVAPAIHQRSKVIPVDRLC